MSSLVLRQTTVLLSRSTCKPSARFFMEVKFSDPNHHCVKDSVSAEFKIDGFYSCGLNVFAA